MSLWSKTPRAMRKRRGEGPSTSFAVRLTVDELEELQDAALHEGITLSEFIRRAALDRSSVGSGRRKEALVQMRIWMQQNFPERYSPQMSDSEIGKWGTEIERDLGQLLGTASAHV